MTMGKKPPKWILAAVAVVAAVALVVGFHVAFGMIMAKHVQ